MDEYAVVAEWDVSTRQTNEGFIRRTIKPARGPMKVRKVRGPVLDKLDAELKRCGDLSCTGKPFIEHRNVPVLMINPRDSRPAWQQVTATLTAAIRSGTLVPGDEPPTTIRQPIPGTSPEDVATVIAEARARGAAWGLYLWRWWSPACAAASCAACRSAARPQRGRPAPRRAAEHSKSDPGTLPEIATASP